MWCTWGMRRRGLVCRMAVACRPRLGGCATCCQTACCMSLMSRYGLAALRVEGRAALLTQYRGSSTQHTSAGLWVVQPDSLST
jgi:hypothetical protein